jgi:putative spermidine/putrescine transport system permease protein
MLVVLNSIRGRLLALYAAIFAIAMLLPLAIVIVVALTTGNYEQFPPRTFGLRWVSFVFHSSQFRNSAILSVILAVLATAIAGVIGFLAAYGFDRWHMPGRGLMIALSSSSLFVPHLLVALGLLEVLSDLHFPTAPLGLLAGDVAITMPFVIGIVMSGLRGLDANLEVASGSLGATRARTLRSVTLPLVSPSVVTALVFSFVVAFDESVISVFLSTPNYTTLPAQIYGYATQDASPVVAAASAILVAVSLVIVLILDHFGNLADLFGGAAAVGQ